MTYCGETTLVKWKRDGGELTSLRCRAWTCQSCAPMRQRQLIALGHRGKPNTFVTLTLRQKSAATPNEAAAKLAHAWRIIVKRAIRENARDPAKQPLPSSGSLKWVWKTRPDGTVARKVRLPQNRLDYLCVIEAHKSGWPHLHIVCRSQWIDHEWLKVQMLDICQSFVVGVERVSKHSQIAGYVAKYCSKCEHKFGNTKRYWQSANYELTKYEKKHIDYSQWWECYTEKTPIHHKVWQWKQFGWQITWISTHHAEGRAPP